MSKSQDRKATVQEGQDVSIKGRDGKIIYASKGGNITIGNGATVNWIGGGKIEITAPNMLCEEINVDALGDSLDY